MKYTKWTEKTWRGITIYLTDHPFNEDYEFDGVFVRPEERPIPPSGAPLFVPKPPPPPPTRKPTGPASKRLVKWFNLLKARGPCRVIDLVPDDPNLTPKQKERIKLDIYQTLGRHPSHFVAIRKEDRHFIWTVREPEK